MFLVDELKMLFFINLVHICRIQSSEFQSVLLWIFYVLLFSPPKLVSRNYKLRENGLEKNTSKIKTENLSFKAQLGECTEVNDNAYSKVKVGFKG